MKVVFFHRHRVSGNYSMENLFDQIRGALPDSVDSREKELSFISKGFFKRLFILVEAFFHQGDINHITGDIHFIALLLKRRRTVLTIHDLGFMNHPNPIRRFLLKWFWIILPVKRCAAVTVVSQATKTDLLKYVDPNDESKIHLIYNPIKSGFAPSPKTFNRVEPTILQIGAKHNKNISRLLKALQGINCKLEIVGKLPNNISDELRGSGLSYSLSENLTDQEMLDKYIKADIVSFVSTTEGFGLPIIEANAIGRVVVTSNVSSMPEIAGDAACLVNPFDVASIRAGFLKVIDDDLFRGKLTSNGYENIKRFDLSEIANQYFNIYKLLIKQKN